MCKSNFQDADLANPSSQHLCVPLSPVDYLQKFSRSPSHLRSFDYFLQRDEADAVSIQSGTEHGVTLGTPIALRVLNKDQKPHDYSDMDMYPRPSHADWTYLLKYGVKASSGGGRSSARETVGMSPLDHPNPLHLGEGTLAHLTMGAQDAWQQVPLQKSTSRKPLASRLSLSSRVLVKSNCPGRQSSREMCSASRKPSGQLTMRRKSTSLRQSIWSCSTRFRGTMWMPTSSGVLMKPQHSEWSACVSNPNLQCCSHLLRYMCILQRILTAKGKLDSIGGTVTCVVRKCPTGLGEPCFDKLEAKLAHAMMSLPATKGFEIGSGFAGTHMPGSRHNDMFVKNEAGDGLRTTTNNSGGVQGGISNGENIYFRCVRVGHTYSCRTECSHV